MRTAGCRGTVRTRWCRSGSWLGSAAWVGGVGHAGLPLPQVVPAAGVRLQQPAGVTDDQGADAPLDRPVDHCCGGLVLGLADPPPMPAFDLAGPPAGLAPPPRSALAGGG